MARNESDSNSHPLGIIFAFTGFYILVYVIAVFGNILTLVAIWRNNKMRTVVNIFLANLACADLVFINLSVFDVVAYLQNGWYTGIAVCKIQCFVIETSYTCSVLTLVAVSLERYFLICHPHMKRRTKKATMIAVAFIWLISALFCSVLLYAYTTRVNDKGRIVCENTVWSNTSRRVFYTVHSIVVYLFPLTVFLCAHWRIFQVVRMPKEGTVLPEKLRNVSESSDSSDSGRRCKMTIYCPKKSPTKDGRLCKTKSGKSRPKSSYKMQRRRRVIKILIVVTTSFMAIWTPFIVIRMLLYFDVGVNSFLWRSSQLLVLSSTAVNSVIYAFMSPQFRKCFVQLVPCLSCILRGKLGANWSYSLSLCGSRKYSESQDNLMLNPFDRGRSARSRDENDLEK